MKTIFPNLAKLALLLATACLPPAESSLQDGPRSALTFPMQVTLTGNSITLTPNGSAANGTTNAPAATPAATPSTPRIDSLSGVTLEALASGTVTPVANQYVRMTNNAPLTFTMAMNVNTSLRCTANGVRGGAVATVNCQGAAGATPTPSATPAATSFRQACDNLVRANLASDPTDSNCKCGPSVLTFSTFRDIAAFEGACRGETMRTQLLAKCAELGASGLADATQVGTDTEQCWCGSTPIVYRSTTSTTGFISVADLDAHCRANVNASDPGIERLRTACTTDLRNERLPTQDSASGCTCGSTLVAYSRYAYDLSAFMSACRTAAAGTAGNDGSTNPNPNPPAPTTTETKKQMNERICLEYSTFYSDVIPLVGACSCQGTEILYGTYETPAAFKTACVGS